MTRPRPCASAPSRRCRSPTARWVDPAASLWSAAACRRSGWEGRRGETARKQSNRDEPDGLLPSHPRPPPTPKRRQAAALQSGGCAAAGRAASRIVARRAHLPIRSAVPHEEDAMRLSGRTAVVTGAGRGLGEAIALRFAGEGAAVMINDMDPETAQGTADRIVREGGRAAVCTGSVTDEAVARELMERAIAAFGSLDILVNNAGITRDKLLRDMAVEDWDAVLNLNLRATFLCS